MIDKNKIRIYGDDKLLAYETKDYKYTLKPWVNYKNQISIDIIITYLSSFNRRTFDIYNQKIPKKHIDILKQLVEYYELTIITFYIIENGYTYRNVFEDIFNSQIGEKNGK